METKRITENHNIIHLTDIEIRTLYNILIQYKLNTDRSKFNMRHKTADKLIKSINEVL